MNIKISFGMIVLNGEPFLRYNLRSLYPYAHQIIVVEGACYSAVATATENGHSVDETLEVLHDFKNKEDFGNKIVIVNACDEGYLNGFWPEKDEMSQAYAKRATGDYLWQVDSDEFYHEEQIARLIRVLESSRPDAVSFPMLTFWGSPKYIANSFYLIRDNAREYHRLFAWGKGYTYKTHRPPTVLDSNGYDTRKKRWLRAVNLEKKGIFLFHYSLLFPHQVFNKVSYYKKRLNSNIDSWEEAVYRNLKKPFRAHNVFGHIGWLERFEQEHPSEVYKMMKDIEIGKLDVPLRACEDVEKLLSNQYYIFATRFLYFCAKLMSTPPVHFLYKIYIALKNKFFRLASGIRS